MTPFTIENEIRRIRQTAKSEADLNLLAFGLLAKTMLSKLPQGDPYMTGIEEFHKKFGLGYESGPRQLTKAQSDFRIKFMSEELNEYVLAVQKGDLEKQFDGLIDLVYVALGTAYLQGFPFLEGWIRVQEANMKKVRATKETASGRNFEFDIVKPPGWIAPTLTDLINDPNIT